MTIVALLDALKHFCIDKTKYLEFPTSVQKNDIQREFRAPDVYKMRLPDSSAAKKVAPYILIQFVSGIDQQLHGKQSSSSAVIRFIFCVYDENEQEGAMMLLNLMEAVRIALLKEVVVGKCFRLDTDAGLESVVYMGEQTAPYYAGELVGTFQLPPIEREVNVYGEIPKQSGIIPFGRGRGCGRAADGSDTNSGAANGEQ